MRGGRQRRREGETVDHGKVKKRRKLGQAAVMGAARCAGWVVVREASCVRKAFQCHLVLVSLLVLCIPCACVSVLSK